MTALPPKKERFCQEYLIDLCGKDAAIRAGYSERTAVSKAAHLLTEPAIAARVKELMDARAARVNVDQDQVLRELARIGYSDIRQLFDPETGKLLGPEKWPEDLARAIASIEVDELFDFDNGRKVQIGYTKKVKFWPKVQALELIGRHQGMFVQKHKHDVEGTLEELVSGSRKKQGEK